VEALLSRESVVVRRQSEDKVREFDARPSIVSLEPHAGEPPAVLDLVLRFTLRAQARPDDVLAVLFPEADPRTVDVERTGLWVERGGERVDPLQVLGPR
jgi:hypothetical protein